MQNRVQKTRWPEETAEQNTAASGQQPVWNSFLWFAYDTFIIPKTNPVTVWQHYNHPPSADRITTSTVLLCQLRHGTLWYYARSNSVVIQTEDIKCVFCNCCQMCTLMWCRACSDDSRETETKKKKTPDTQAAFCVGFWNLNSALRKGEKLWGGRGSSIRNL